MTAQPAENDRGGVPEVFAAAGVIVVLSLPPSVARTLAVGGGVPPEDLHVTLAFLGMTSELGEARLEAVRDSVARLAARTPTLTGRVTGVGRFSREDGQDVAYVSVDAPELPAFRETLLCELAEGVGLEADSRYGFTPHVTLAFIGAEDEHPYDRLEPLSFAFDTLEVWTGPRRDVYPLQVTAEAESACEATQAAENAAGSASPHALRAVVSDWVPRFARELAEVEGRERVRLVADGLDDLHTRLLAAHLASPVRAYSATTPEETLLTRASRVRSIEVDLGLILGTATRNLQRSIAGVKVTDLEGHLRGALGPLLAWAEAADEESG